MTFDDTTINLGFRHGAIHLPHVSRAAPKPKRELHRDFDAARGIIHAVVLGAGIWAWLYVAYLFLR